MSWSRAPKGTTLIELMVVVLIAAVLVVVAYPSFTSQVRRSARAEARAALLEARAREEQFFQDQKRYTNDPVALRLQLTPSGTGDSALHLTDSGKYSIHIECASAGCAAYDLQAVPQASQAADALCGTLTLTSDGIKDATGTNPGECW